MAEELIPDAISAISIQGFKSFLEEQRIEIRPLTLLAGANSSGKSSALQPLLLLKQTLEAPFDPGPLLLDGPNVRFTSVSQLLARTGHRAGANKFSVSLEKTDGQTIKDVFKKAGEFGVDLAYTEVANRGRPFVLTAAMASKPPHEGMEIFRDRCFFDVSYTSSLRRLRLRGNVTKTYRKLILSILHVPGLRGNPARSYRAAAVEEFSPGTFENYVASVVLSWQLADDPRLADLDRYLQILGLTGQVRSKAIAAAQVEVLVGRLPVESDLINIADVGLGVSQVLPVLVALRVAKPGQLVYLEQPELHLHPRAQQALAAVLAEAANRGVRVVAETHSSILLLAVQTLVAEGKISPDKVKLHWFQRDSRGATKVTSADLDQLGAYGDWPEDFGEVEAAVDNRYLDAVESKVSPRKKRANK
jgi:putative AbiEii toxin of type IV toxin-antitoxin system/AAA ATPase-like protein